MGTKRSGHYSVMPKVSAAYVYTLAVTKYQSHLQSLRLFSSLFHALYFYTVAKKTKTRAEMSFFTQPGLMYYFSLKRQNVKTVTRSQLNRPLTQR